MPIRALPLGGKALPLEPLQGHLCHTSYGFPRCLMVVEALVSEVCPLCPEVPFQNSPPGRRDSHSSPSPPPSEPSLHCSPTSLLCSLLAPSPKWGSDATAVGSAASGSRAIGTVEDQASLLVSPTVSGEKAHGMAARTRGSLFFFSSPKHL